MPPRVLCWKKARRLNGSIRSITVSSRPGDRLVEVEQRRCDRLAGRRLVREAAEQPAECLHLSACWRPGEHQAEGMAEAVLPIGRGRFGKDAPRQGLSGLDVGRVVE